MDNPILKKYGVIAVVAILIIILLVSCSGGKKNVAIDFATAMLKDFNAKEMVSLMSKDYKETVMEQKDAATEKILISKFKEDFKSVEKTYENKYGNKWKIEIQHIDTYEASDDIVAVALSITYKGSGGFLGLSDKEDTKEMTVYLIKEGVKWKVSTWD